MRFKQRLTLRTEPEDAPLVRAEDTGQFPIIPYAEFSGRERVAIDIKVNPIVAWEKGASTGIADSGGKRHLLCFIRHFFSVFNRPKNLTVGGKIGCGDPVVRRQQVMELVLKIGLPGYEPELRCAKRRRWLRKASAIFRRIKKRTERRSSGSLLRSWMRASRFSSAARRAISSSGVGPLATRDIRPTSDTAFLFFCPGGVHDLDRVGFYLDCLTGQPGIPR